MTHTLEFPRDDSAAQQAKRITQAETAAAYQRCFGTPEGQRVLSDLRAKFGHHRRRFDPRHRDPSPLHAALIDGQCEVLREIEAALTL